MKELKEMLDKKKKLDPAKKESKLGVLKDLKGAMSEMMGEDMKGKMMKATVAAKNPEDLEQGLEKAKDIVSEMPEMESEEETSEPSEMYGQMDEMIEKWDSPEEIDEIIKKLQEKKQELLKG